MPFKKIWCRSGDPTSEVAYRLISMKNVLKCFTIKMMNQAPLRSCFHPLTFTMNSRYVTNTVLAHTVTFTIHPAIFSQTIQGIKDTEYRGTTP